jgi:hypothetical protein
MGNNAKDLAAARRFLAEQGIDKPQQRLTVRDRMGFLELTKKECAAAGRKLSSQDHTRLASCF